MSYYDKCAFSASIFQEHKKDLLLYYLYLCWDGADREVSFAHAKPYLIYTFKEDATTFAAAEYLTQHSKLSRRTIEKYIATYKKKLIIEGEPGSDFNFTFFIATENLKTIMETLLKTRTYADANNIFRVFVFLFMKCIRFGAYRDTYVNIEKETHIQQGVFSAAVNILDAAKLIRRLPGWRLVNRTKVYDCNEYTLNGILIPNEVKRRYGEDKKKYFNDLPHLRYLQAEQDGEKVKDSAVDEDGMEIILLPPDDEENLDKA